MLGAVADTSLAPKTGKQARSVLSFRAKTLHQQVKLSGDGDVESMGGYADLSG